MPDSQCGEDEWFWLLGFLAALSYTLWYTFKDDMLKLGFNWIRCLKCILTKFGGNSPDDSTPKIVGVMKIVLPGNMASSVAINEATQLATRQQDQTSGVEKQNAGSGTSEKQTSFADKNYFGIIVYFVQMSAVMKIDIHFSNIDKNESFLDKIVHYIEMFLNIEITQFSFNVCPVKGLTMMGKYLYRLLFLLGIYTSWIGIIIITIIILQITKKMANVSKRIKSFNIKLIKGVIEIIKYTYSGFCVVIFTSLVCSRIGEDYVWFYDGSNVCLEAWQGLMVLFGIFYAIPFPFVLAMAMKLLRNGDITHVTFILCSLCPFFGFCVIIIYQFAKSVKNKSNVANDSTLSEESEAILSVLQGPYREDDSQVIMYWEAMISVRRLLISTMTLLAFKSMRMIIISVLCILFLYQHSYMSPFNIKQSNRVEGLSLFLLSVNSVSNLLKACLSDSGIVPSGPNVIFYKGLEMCEKLFVLIIIMYVLFIELLPSFKCFCQKKSR